MREPSTLHPRGRFEHLDAVLLLVSSFLYRHRHTFTRIELIQSAGNLGVMAVPLLVYLDFLILLSLALTYACRNTLVPGDVEVC